MSMHTPLRRVTGLGSAGEGTGHFWRQRLTAAANVPLVLFFVWLLLANLGASRADLAAAFANPLVTALALGAIVSITWHMRLGMQVIVEDYVGTEGAKVVLLVLNAFFCFAVAAVAAVSVLLLGLGG
jgi:succinate dehydrogenase / fumarate reductase membrane anchor subunit